MYILLVYDVGEKRVGKVLRFLRKHLNWIQNSVFEGNVTESQLLKIKNGLRKIINEEEDSVIIFTVATNKWVKKEIVGKEKSPIDNFI